MPEARIERLWGAGWVGAGEPGGSGGSDGASGSGGAGGQDGAPGAGVSDGASGADDSRGPGGAPGSDGNGTGAARAAAGSGSLSDEQILALYAADPRDMSGRRDTGEQGEPWLRVNFVSSLDGSATHAGLSGGLGTPADKRVFDLLRRLCDVVVVGAGTVRAEGYGAMRVDAAASAWRSAHGFQPQPVFAIVSGSLDLDPAGSVFAEAPVTPIVVTAASSSPERRAALAEVADVVVCGDEAVDTVLMRQLLAERGLLRQHGEGGPSLFGRMIAERSVDELCLTLSPRLEAGFGPRISGAVANSEALDMRLAHVLHGDGTLLLRYIRA
ncbi:pyrimidine reductase family protein [Compostimonas suwonensis]|uniref:Riboflavin biosynthesis pyrimidine reductase n=1 Tax=Compostimonas suwonensis TaxID=1048394 RepID=A0A2M9BVK6_9MICO|nr:pyrimidine reductase family protein [Compostimonas suwonensis]PJJ61976.1 riboflavin biosynthesis pyrimidine reductase [Compostimonas suwonensis]